MRLNLAIASIPAILASIGSVVATEAESPSSAIEDTGSSNNSTIEERDSILDNVSDLFYDNGVFDLEAIDIRLQVSTIYMINY